MTTEATALQRLGYVLIGISPLLSLSEIADLVWRAADGTLSVSVQLATGPVLTVNVGLEGSGTSPAQVVVTAFDLFQQDLSETEQYRGQARPACRPAMPTRPGAKR